MVGKKIFSQIIGIPTGSDPAAVFGNLFLYYCESRWIIDLQKNELIKARKMCNVFHFIDGLNANFRDKYPKNLQLHRENSKNSVATFFRSRHQDKKY